MQYSAHAKKQMAKRRFTQNDVESTIANPTRGAYAPAAKATLEHYGFAHNGRPLLVVTNRVKNYVITVIESETI